MTQRQDQRNRTRAALLEGARAILMRGEVLTVTAAAREAGARIHFGRPMLRQQIRLMARHMGVTAVPDA